MKTRRKFIQSAVAGVGGLAGAAWTGGIAHARPAPGEVTIVPRPRFVEFSVAGGFELRPNVPIIWGRSLFATEYRWSAQPLQRKLRGPQAPAVVPGAELSVPLPLSLASCRGHAGYVVSGPDMAIPPGVRSDWFASGS